MDQGVIATVAEVEPYHWWYQGLRMALASCLKRVDPPVPPHPRVLDAGCGTGENLRLLANLLQPSYLAGFDTSEEALALAQQRVPGADLYRSDICAPALHDEQLDVVISCDVIYIPGVERSMAGLQRLVDHLAPGGLLVLNLPAYNWLRSEHDVAIHTKERYTARSVRALLARLGLSVELLSYRVCLLFPAVALARLARKPKWRHRPQARTDLERTPPGPLNDLLASILRAENRLIASGVLLPWGSSVFAIGRKPHRRG
jgi:SAM-dependent methyltransferase